MRKLFSICVIMALFLMGCALTQWYAQTHYQQFEITLDQQKVAVNLPNELPSMENAVLKTQGCFNAKVCWQRYCVSMEPGHNHVDFISINTDVIALVWIKSAEMDPEKRFLAWIYVEKKPISVPINRIRDLIKEDDSKVDDSVFFKELAKNLAELQQLIIELNGLTAQDL